MAASNSISAKNTDRIIGTGEMAELTRRCDWSSTPVGPMELWPDTLVTTVNMLLASCNPMFLWWGSDLVQFYNDAYRMAIREDKHPRALGQRGIECWPETWHIIGQQIDSVMTRGESTWNVNQLVPIFRSGRLEEVFWTYSYSPVRDVDGTVRGTLVVCSVTTEQVVSARRSRTLLALSQSEPAQMQETAPLARCLIDTLATSPEDIPFALLFETSGETLRLTGETGAIPESMKLPDAWPFRAGVSNQAMLVNDVRPMFGEIVLKPWPEPIKSAYILPLASQAGATEHLMIFGVSPRLPFDSQYETFFRLAGSCIAGVLQAAQHRSESRRTELQRLQLFQTMNEQRELLMNIVQSAPVGIAVLDKDLKFCWHNPRYASFLDEKWREQSIQGRSIREVLSRADESGTIAIIKKVSETGEPFVSTAYEYLGFERGITYWRWTALRLLSGDVLLVVNEITEQVKAIKEAESAGERLRLAHQASQLGTYEWNLLSNSLLWTDEFYEVAGFDRESSPSVENYLSYVHPDDRERLREELARDEREQRASRYYEHRLIGKDGVERNIVSRGHVYLDGERRPARLIGAIANVTERKRSEDALRTSEKLAAVGRLASSIAHEINNPLEAVVNLLYLAERGGSSSQVRKYIHMAQHELGRVTHITTQTLRFHRQSTHAVQTDLQELIESVLTLYQGRIQNAGIRVERRYRTPGTIVGFASELRQVIANLIGNGIDAMQVHGSGCLSLRLRDATDKTGRSGVMLSIGDTGIGMSGETRRNLFKPFFSTKGHLGTGLGLWISGEIIQKHGGVAHVRSSRSEANHGTVFAIFFPRVQ